jgi:hypothetical protein
MPVYDDEQRKRFFHITKANDEYGSLVGRLATKTSETDPKAVPYTKEDGGVVYRRYHASIGGVLTGVSVQKVEGKKGAYYVWELVMDGGNGETFMLSVNLKSSSSNSIMHRLPSCDLTKEVRFTPFYFSDKEKIITIVYQKNEEGKWAKVDKLWAYDSENKVMKGGMPDLVVTEDPVTKEKSYDDKEQNAFMWAYYEKNILPVLAENANNVSVAAPIPEDTPEATESGLESEVTPGAEDDVTVDDLPF